jgi:hypothetical protein
MLIAHDVRILPFKHLQELVGSTNSPIIMQVNDPFLCTVVTSTPIYTKVIRHDLRSSLNYQFQSIKL